jgi:hypothetical protein
MKAGVGIIAALSVLLAVPTAILANAALHIGPDTVVHFMVGGGFLLFAVSILGSELPRWLNRVGALSAAAFGGIFLLQGVSEVLGSEALKGIAFGVLGHEVERVLPDLTFVWFIGLLLAASDGRTRTLGWLVMSIVIGTEIATVASVLLGFDFPVQKFQLLLPFTWFLAECIKRRRAGQRRAPQPDHRLAETTMA